MNKTTPTTSQVSESWDTYWQGTGDTGAFTSGGVSHPAIRAFWIAFFNGAKHTDKKPSILDIASGNGAVVEYALEAFENVAKDVTCLDVSEASVKNIHTRFANVKGIVADACSIPLKTGSFDIVTSQYGVEYAGRNAILEAARLVADNGTLALLMHCDAGSIHLECQQSLNAIERTQVCRFIPLAVNMFDAGFKSVRGADRQLYDQAAKKLAPAITELESIMRQYGSHVAGDSISRLYNDVGQIHQRIQHYEPENVLTWLQTMNQELNAYSKRMSSMSLAAISSSTFEQIKDDLKERLFSIDTADTLFVPGNELPMAWVLIAKKQPK